MRIIRRPNVLIQASNPLPAMQVTITSTSKVVELNGVPARIWEGHTDSGIKVHCYVTRIACDPDADQTQFKAELEEHAAPSAEMAAIPMRMIL